MPDDKNAQNVYHMCNFTINEIDPNPQFWSNQAEIQGILPSLRASQFHQVSWW